MVEVELRWMQSMYGWMIIQKLRVTLEHVSDRLTKLVRDFGDKIRLAEAITKIYTLILRFILAKSEIIISSTHNCVLYLYLRKDVK